MNKLLQIQKELIPQGLELMEKRYSILRQVSLSEPIGRRNLSSILNISERIIRSETEFLKEQGLIEVAGSGMTITTKGIYMLDELKDIIKEISGLTILQDKIKNKLGIKKVLLVPGSYDNNKSILKDIARCASEYFLEVLKDGDTVALTGGNTTLEFANSIKSDKKYNSTTVVPSRGSMGNDVEKQANNIVAIISKKLNSSYKLLHIPDQLGEDAIKMLSQEPEIKSTLEYIQKTDILVFGVGRADEMASRRKLSEEVIKNMISKDAVGEAFGYYFNKQGEVVHKINTVGIDLDTFKNTKNTIAIYGGSKKAEAIIAISKMNKNLVLVTDEHSGLKILEY